MSKYFVFEVEIMAKYVKDPTLVREGLFEMVNSFCTGAVIVKMKEVDK